MTMTALGPSWALHPIETLEGIESGIFYPQADLDYLGGGSFGNWWIGLDTEDPKNFHWVDFEAAITANGAPTALWLMPALRDPAVFPAEHMLSFDECLEVLDNARSITGGAITYYVSGPPAVESCTSVGHGQHEYSVGVAKFLARQPNCEVGPVLEPYSDAETVAADDCHSRAAKLNVNALILQSWWGA